MPDIQTLTSAVQSLERSAGLWNRAALWLIAATAIVASLYFIVSWVASKKSTALQSAQAALIHAKDEQLSRDLKVKDDKIAETNREAKRIESEANQKIADTNKETKRIETEAQKEIARLTTEAETARAGIATAQAAAAEATKEAQQADVKRLELEKAVAPRSTGDQAAFARTLKEFSGTPVAIETVNDFEARRFAGQIAFVLAQAGWRVSGPFIIGDAEAFLVSEGVVVATAVARREGQLAAVSLVVQLNERDIDANSGIREPDFPEGVVSVRVGIKPTRYFESREMRQLYERLRDEQRQRDRESLERLRRDAQMYERLRRRP
jgi:hypothetical protein